MATHTALKLFTYRDKEIREVSMAVIRAIEVGFGTSSATTGVASSG